MNIEDLDENMVLKDPEKGLHWYNAEAFTIEGKGWKDTAKVYHRVPAKVESIVRPAIWDLGRNSSGISIHFTTDSTSLAVKWDGFEAMNHMTALGVSGLDLYVKHQGKWKWLAVGRPSQEQNEIELITGIPSEVREYILYLPLYNQINKIELGVPEKFSLKATAPREKKPIVFYGTSITQGGCASRPGMCYSAILGRWLDNPTINLGFSGNGIMEPEVIDLLCELDPAVFVIDCLPNMNEEMIIEREENALRKLRTAHPNTPIVLIDNILYCESFLKRSFMDEYIAKNSAQYAIYEKLVGEGMSDLHYIKDTDLIGVDGEGTVDGCHLTDLGYMRFSEQLIGPLQKILAK